MKQFAPITFQLQTPLAESGKVHPAGSHESAGLMARAIGARTASGSHAIGTRSRIPLLIISAIFIVLSTFNTPFAADSISLDGTWQIIFDKDNQGREAGWRQEAAFAKIAGVRSIEVPSCWEEIERDYEGVAIYGRHFKVPRTWKGRNVTLRFDAVNYIAEVWLNGHALGRHEGGYGPFSFRIDDLLRIDDENFLSVRVVGPIIAESKVIDGLGQNDAPHWRGAIAGGIWQSVHLIATGPVMVHDTFVRPRLQDHAAAIRVTLDNTDIRSREIELEMAINLVGSQAIVARDLSRLTLRPGRNEFERTLVIPDARLWCPDEPNLYNVTLRVDGQDEPPFRFGMRELTIRNRQFELNGRPIYLKGVFFEGLYPTRLALPDNRDMAVREITLAKEAGFNMIRPWRKPPPTMWLDLCDELGILVIGGIPIECMDRWPTITPQLADRVANEIRSAIMRDRNRACIVQWEIFNEINESQVEMKRMKHAMSMLARELDPSRLILDESGGFADGANIYLPYQYEPEKFNDIHIYPGAPIDDLTYAGFQILGKTQEEIRALGIDSKVSPNRFAKPGLMTLVSEIGYGSIPNVVENNARFKKTGNLLTPPYRYHQMLEESTRAVLKQSKLDAIYLDLEKFCLEQQENHAAANKRMIEAIRTNTTIRGYCVHALTDGDWVLGAGLLDLWRNPKISYRGTREANQPRYLAPRVTPRNVYATQGATIAVTGVNDRDTLGGSLSLEVVAADGKIIHAASAPVSLVTGVSELARQRLDATALSGSYIARVRLQATDGSVIAENSTAFDVFSVEALAAPACAIAVLSTSDDPLCRFLKKHGVEVLRFGSDTPTHVPVLVASAKAKTAAEKDRFRALEIFVRQGGTAVYLETLIRPSNPYWQASLPDSEILPIKFDKEHALGLWIGVSHVVVDHPVFSGLPVNRSMGQIYENVWSPHCLKNIAGDLIVASVSYGFHAHNTVNQNYLGPEPAWYGMDMGVAPHGRGRYLLSTLRIIENLGSDPVADRILFNMLRWTTR